MACCYVLVNGGSTCIPLSSTDFSTNQLSVERLISEQSQCLIAHRMYSCSHGGDGGDDGSSDMDGTTGDGGKDDQWECPKCGDPCLSLDTCTCRLGVKNVR